MSEKINDDVETGYPMPVNLKYKDGVFRTLFNTKEKLLELYNGLNNSNFTDVTNLRINTLSDAVYMGYKNDISFVFNSYMYLFEHQSTFSPNLPLRNLFYVARLLEKELKDAIIYSKKKIPVDMPKFVVFYNGVEKDLPDKSKIRLSDLYKTKDGEVDLELVVTIININKGKNKELMELCTTLKEYSLFVDVSRQYIDDMKRRGKKNYIKKGVNKAVDYCIENDILADFLKERKAEVISMTITEWNEEEVMKKIAEENKEEGYSEGLEHGLERGEFNTIADLYKEGVISLEIVLRKLNITEEEFLDKLEEYTIGK